MEDVAEAVGSAAHGGLLTRAVEREEVVSSPVTRGHTHEAACLNCGTALVGAHCHHCGQQAHVHRTLSAFFHDLLHGVLHFEGKMWRTLPMLLWHPGRLTREYIDGRRASYISPVAMFLFVVFMSFAVFQLLGGSNAMLPGVGADALGEAERAYLQTGEQLTTAQEELETARLEQDQEQITSLAADVADLQRERAALASALDVMGSDAAPADEAREESIATVNGVNLWQNAMKNPQLLAYKLQSNVYKFAWLLIPISVPFVWLLYCWRRKFRMYDHTVFTTYSITFMIALAGVSAILIYLGQDENWLALEPIGATLLLYAPVHMYRQLRGAYGSSRAGAFIRMLLLSLFAWIAIALFATALAFMSA